MTTAYFEDLAVGDRFNLGDYEFTTVEIKSFAEKFDPHSFHLDEAEAADSIWGELIASGLHTLSATFRLLHEGPFNEIEVQGGRGIDELRYHRPVKPGDVISGEMEVVQKELPDGGHDGGYVDFNVTVRNQNGATVLTFTTLGLIQRQVEGDGRPNKTE